MPLARMQSPRGDRGARARGVWRRLALAAALPLALAACNTDNLLEVEDPDIIDPAVTASAEGAEALRVGAIRQLSVATSGVETADPASAFLDNFFMMSGMLADEFRSGNTFVEHDETDRRNIRVQNAGLEDAFRSLHRGRVNAQLAAKALEEYSPDAPAWHIPQMFLVQAYAETLLAEYMCSGVPFIDYELDGSFVSAAPLPTAEILERAIAHVDSGLTVLGEAAGADEDRIRHALQVVKGRALLNLGRYADAAAAVAGVPTDAQWVMEYSPAPLNNGIWEYNNNERRWTVSGGEGTNGIDFATAGDPRVPVCRGGDAVCRANGVTNARVFDSAIASVLPFWVQLKFPTRESPVPLTDGIEARLIEAEAALQAGDVAGWLGIHNTLRASVEGLDPLTDPGSLDARVDLHFRERAFWLFATGHRLGDMRRLIRQYGRDAETVFPTGDYIKGGTYGTDVNFPVSQAEENNPNFTGCLNRDA